MRIVIDTNILVSFAIRPTADFEKLFDYIAGNDVTLVSEETIAELFDVLSRDKFRRYIPLSYRRSPMSPLRYKSLGRQRPQ
jgi:putative PIN family toxin of toxin-antitoxin system